MDASKTIHNYFSSAFILLIFCQTTFGYLDYLNIVIILLTQDFKFVTGVTFTRLFLFFGDG